MIISQQIQIPNHIIHLKIHYMSIISKWKTFEYSLRWDENWLKCNSMYRMSSLGHTNVCCCSVTKSCPTLCNSMGCSTPGFPVPHYLPEFAQVNVQCTGDTIQPSHPLSPFAPASNLSMHSGSFPMSWLFTSDGQSTGASASASVIPVNIQGWLPLRLTGLISLLSNGLSTVFSSMTVQKHQSSKASILQQYQCTCIHIHAFNMSANVENSAVATGLEKVSFHYNPKEGQCQRMYKLPHNCTHYTC